LSWIPCASKCVFKRVFFFHGIDKGDGGVDELGKVFIASENQGRHAGRFGLFSQGTDHIVSFDTAFYE